LLLTQLQHFFLSILFQLPCNSFISGYHALFQSNTLLLPNKYTVFKITFLSVMLPPWATTSVTYSLISFLRIWNQLQHSFKNWKSNERDMKHNAFKHVSKPLRMDYKHQNGKGQLYLRL
jgi:hypothetical protein